MLIILWRYFFSAKLFAEWAIIFLLIDSVVVGVKRTEFYVWRSQKNIENIYEFSKFEKKNQEEEEEQDASIEQITSYHSLSSQMKEPDPLTMNTKINLIVCVQKILVPLHYENVISIVSPQRNVWRVDALIAYAQCKVDAKSDFI